MSESALELLDVFCVHRSAQGDAASLQGLSLTVSAGERICVLGPSGAGKTTLLRVIAGLQQPSAGDVRVLGRDVGRLKSAARSAFRHAEVGFLHQHAELALSPDLPIAEAVALPLALRGIARRERRTRALELLEAAGLGAHGRALPGQLSGGERQRAAVCAALIHRPRLVLADEPTAELDEASAVLVSGLLRRLAEAHGATLIVVSHDAAMARGSERVLMMRDGRVVEDQGALVVGSGGWLRLDPELLGAAAIGRRAQARLQSDRLVLTPVAGDPSPSRLAEPEHRRRCEPMRVALRSVGRTRGIGRSRAAVIEDLTLEFAPGQLTLVTGRSGAGKTTLLEVVGLLAAPTTGELELDGQAIGSATAQRRAALRRSRIGYLPQEPTPVGFLSAEENVSLSLRIRGHAAAEAIEGARGALEAVGLSHRCRQRVARLSAGEAQRVALAQALACADGLLVVDEPTSRLDERNAARIARLLCSAAHGDGQTVICASHDPWLIQQADTIVDLWARVD